MARGLRVALQLGICQLLSSHRKTTTSQHPQRNDRNQIPAQQGQYRSPRRPAAALRPLQMKGAEHLQLTEGRAQSQSHRQPKMPHNYHPYTTYTTPLKSPRTETVSGTAGNLLKTMSPIDLALTSSNSSRTLRLQVQAFPKERHSASQYLQVDGG